MHAHNMLHLIMTCLRQYWLRQPELENIILGDDCAGDTPLPIPNRVVKPRCADGTASELVWQSR